MAPGAMALEPPLGMSSVKRSCVPETLTTGWLPVSMTDTRQWRAALGVSDRKKRCPVPRAAEVVCLCAAGRHVTGNVSLRE
jgi:hypothetical protein